LLANERAALLPLADAETNASVPFMHHCLTVFRAFCLNFAQGTVKARCVTPLCFAALFVFSRFSAGFGLQADSTRLVCFGVWIFMQIIVRDNNVDQALRALKKKLQREGVYREMKMRRHYEKPSEKRAREKAAAVRRARKMERKQMERDGAKA
jgi:small subunit ribosomal protein S21